ncbi:MAG: folate-binding protein YgfZ [Synechococcus sp.]
MSSIQSEQYSSLHAAQIASGAAFETLNGHHVAIYFGDHSAAPSLKAAFEDVALFDRSHWSLLEMRGPDRLDYLHNQTTNNIKALSPGQGCETCIVSPTARLIDLVTAYATPDSVFLLASPSDSDNSRAFLSLNRLIAFSNAQLTDVGSSYSLFTVVGPRSQRLLNELSIALPSSTIHSHTYVETSTPPICVASGTGLSIEGYTLIVPKETSANVWSTLIDGGATACGSEAWEVLRIRQGRPAIGKELTDEFNPLEAGLWHTASFTKGCYIGQETIARLDTFNGVKQQLRGLQFSTPVPIGATILVDEQRAGIITSITTQPINGSYRGLGYIRTKLGGDNLDIVTEGKNGRTVALPYSTREQQPSE